MVPIITDSYLNSIINSDIYLEHTYLMKYIEYAGRFKRLWKESDAPKTQKELAKWLDYSQPMINYWLNGEKLPSMETAIKIADKFDVCVEWLITGKGLMRPNDAPELQNHINVSDLTDDQRALINQMMVQFTPKTIENNTNKALTSPDINVGGGGQEPYQQAQSQDRRVSDNDRRIMLKEMAIEQDRCVMERHKEALEINARYINLIKESCKNNECYCEPPCKDANDHSRTMSFKAILNSAQGRKKEK